MADENQDWFAANAPQQPEQDWFAQNAPKPVEQPQKGGVLSGIASAIGSALNPINIVKGALDIGHESDISNIMRYGKTLGEIVTGKSPDEAIGKNIPELQQQREAVYGKLGTKEQAAALTGIGLQLGMVALPFLHGKTLPRAPGSLAEVAGIAKPEVPPETVTPEPITPVATDTAAATPIVPEATPSVLGTESVVTAPLSTETSLGKVEPVAPDLPTGTGGATEIHPRFQVVGSRGRGEATPTSDYDLVTTLTPEEHAAWVNTPEGEYPVIPKEIKDAANAGHDVFIKTGEQAWKVEPHPVSEDPNHVVVERVSQIEKNLLSGERKPSPVSEAPGSTTAAPLTQTERSISGNKTPVAQTTDAVTGEAKPEWQQFEVGKEYTIGRERVHRVVKFDPDLKIPVESFDPHYQEVSRTIVKETPKFVITNFGEKWAKSTFTHSKVKEVAQETPSVSVEGQAPTAPLSTETPTGGIENAIQEPSTGEVLQRQPQETGTTGSQRVGMEQGIQREKPAEALQTATPQEQVIPEGAKANVTVRDANGEPVQLQNVDAKQWEAKFTERKSAYEKLMECLG